MVDRGLDHLAVAGHEADLEPWPVRPLGQRPHRSYRLWQGRATLPGLLGVSRLSGDTRELQCAAEAGDERSALAIEVYLHRLGGSIAAMAAAMGGFDALAFTGGVGEGSAAIRAGTCERLEFLGLDMDPERNNTTDSGDRVLSTLEAAKSILLVHAREDVEIAAQVRSVLAR